MARKLKVWNGRGWGRRNYDENGSLILDPTGKEFCNHAYVCAYSRGDAVRAIAEATGYDIITANEIKIYWAECWGSTMDGIEKERGVWTTQDYNDKPKRIR